MVAVFYRMICAVVCWAVFAGMACAQDKGAMELNLLTNKTEYAAGEAVVFTLQFRNLSDSDTNVYIDKLYNSHLFKIKDSEGKLLDDEWTVVYDHVASKEDYHLIKAGTALAWEIVADIKENKEKELFLEFGDSRIRLPGAGEYTVVVLYEGWAGQTFGLENIFSGTLVTEPLTLRIKGRE